LLIQPSLLKLAWNRLDVLGVNSKNEATPGFERVSTGSSKVDPTGAPARIAPHQFR